MALIICALTFIWFQSLFTINGTATYFTHNFSVSDQSFNKLQSEIEKAPERLLGHELAHAYINIFGGTYHDAVRFENIIARELDPNAPIRAISDHGTSKPLGLK